MKTFYIYNPPLFWANSAKVAFRSIYGRIKKQTTFLVLSMLLLSFSSFGQGSNVAYQFTSTGIGPWHEPSTWGKPASSNPVAGTHYPGPTDDVKILNGHIVNVASGEYSCKNLLLVGGGGNPKEGGQIIIGNFDTNNSDPVAKLNVANVKFSIANGKPKQRATLRIGYNGHITVSEAIYKISITGNGSKEDLITTNANTDIFYSFRRASTIEYKGTNQTLFNFDEVTVTDNGVSETSTTYGNLLLSGSGVKTPTAGLIIRSNLTANAGVTVDALAFTHTITGQFSNAGTINAGNSIINVGGNFVNNNIFNGSTSATSFNQLQVTGNFSNNSTGTFNANSIMHTISGNIVNAGSINAASSTINIGRNFTNTGTFDSGTGTVIYNGAADGTTQDVAGVVYNLLQFSGISSKTAVAGFTTKSNLLINTGSNLNAGSFTHSILGNFSNAGTLNAASSTITVSGNFSSTNFFDAGNSTFILNGAQKNVLLTGSVSSAISEPASFKNLIISNGPATLSSNVRVFGVLDLEDGIFTGTNTLALGLTGELRRPEEGGKYVMGNLSASRPLRPGSFEAPTVESYGNIGFVLTNKGTVISTPDATEVYINVSRQTGSVIPIGNKTSAARMFNLSTSTLASAQDLEFSFSFMKRELTEESTDYSLYGERMNGGVFEFMALSSNQNLTATGYTYTRANESHLGRYTIAAAPKNNYPLPVELTWFKAQRQAQGVLLTWETASEKENKGFEVQVSTNGKNFSKLSFVDSKVVNSSVAQHYSFTDNTAVAFGTRYYRLAQVDLDNTMTYSNIKAVDMETKIATAAAFPNPFAEGQEVTVRLPQGGASRQVSLLLTTTMGKAVFEQQVQVQDGQVELAVNMAKANAKGLYLLYVIDNNTKHTFKLLKK